MSGTVSVVGSPGTTAAGPLLTTFPPRSSTLTDESFGSGASPNVIVTTVGAVESVAPAPGTEDCGNECAECCAGHEQRRGERKRSRDATPGDEHGDAYAPPAGRRRVAANSPAAPRMTPRAPIPIATTRAAVAASWAWLAAAWAAAAAD